jgi:hypothetical protein
LITSSNFRRLFDWQICRFGTLVNLINVRGGTSLQLSEIRPTIDETTSVTVERSKRLPFTVNPLMRQPERHR